MTTPAVAHGIRHGKVTALMRDMVAIDGPRGAGKSLVAAAVAAGLGWPLLDLAGEGSVPDVGLAPPTGAFLGPVVLEGSAILQSAGAGARWKFYLEADPRERARRLTESTAGAVGEADCGSTGVGGFDGQQAVLLAGLLAEEQRNNGASPRLPPGVILIDTTDLSAAAVAGMIVAIVHGEME